MKLFIIPILIAVVFISCNKATDVAPTGTTPTKTTPDTTLALSHDDSIHIVSFHVNTQSVNTSVSGNNLFMVFDENVDLMLNTEGYQKTSALHLLENFKGTSLAAFDFTTIAEQGNITVNWVDDNLNNVILKSTSDTTVNNKKMVKVNVHRAFTFYKIYNSNQDAIDEQNTLLSQKSDTVAFSSYCYYNQKNYTTYSVKTNTVYTK